MWNRTGMVGLVKYLSGNLCRATFFLFGLNIILISGQSIMKSWQFVHPGVKLGRGKVFMFTSS